MDFGSDAITRRLQQFRGGGRGNDFQNELGTVQGQFTGGSPRNPVGDLESFLGGRGRSGGSPIASRLAELQGSVGSARGTYPDEGLQMMGGQKPMGFSKPDPRGFMDDAMFMQQLNPGNNLEGLLQFLRRGAPGRMK